MPTTLPTNESLKSASPWFGSYLAISTLSPFLIVEPSWPLIVDASVIYL